MSVKTEPAVSHEIAQAVIDRAFSDRTVVSVSKMHGGEIAAVYEIGLADQPRLILKVYPQSLHWKMRKEANVIALLADRFSVPIPEILLVDDTRELLDFNFTLMTKLDGVILGSIERTLPLAQFGSAYRQVGALLRDFHQISMDAFGYIGADGIITPHPTNQAHMAFQFDRKLAEFQERGGQEALASRVAEYVGERDALFRACQRSTLCHNDFHAGNILAAVDSDSIRLCGVLDFEGARAGDPVMDVAKAAYYLSDDARKALLQGYGDLANANGAETLRLYHLYFILEPWCWMAEIGNWAPLEKLADELERYSSASAA
jgi:aminoglycoside phosphotransferase (APT) family kinase protein